jgi:palmitoyltransferase
VQQARAELERIAYSDYYYDRRDPRRPRYCKRCQAWKPERTHHCSVSGHCVLRMDHYCIWVVNCVGLLNYKHFLLFLWYTFLSSLGAVALLVQPMLEFFTREDRGG